MNMEERHPRTEFGGERPMAGRRSSLHSSKEGLKIPQKKEGHPRGMIHDSEHVLGWNQRG